MSDRRQSELSSRAFGELGAMTRLAVGSQAPDFLIHAFPVCLEPRFQAQDLPTSSAALVRLHRRELLKTRQRSDP